MKQTLETEILFDDFTAIEKQLGTGYLKNSVAVNSDCVNNIFPAQEHENLSA